MSSIQHIQENIRPGLIVEYLQNNQPVLAWITETQGSRVRALNINQREIKLPAARILPWTGPGYGREKSREEISHLLSRHNRSRTREQENISTIEIWELAQGDIDQARPDWFAGLIFTSPGPDLVAAMGRAMLQDRAHFKFNPPFFEVYPEDVVQERLVQEKAARERERLTSAGREFFRMLWHLDVQAPVREISDEWAAEKLKELLITRVVSPEDESIQDIWANVTKGLPQDPHLGFILARKWGIYPEHHNFLLDQAGYVFDDTWHEKYESEAQFIARAYASTQKPAQEEGYISIDSGTTRDIDDAFLIQTLDSGYLLKIALACPAMNWSIDSDLDRAVSARASSLYLPEGTSNMLPRFMAEEMFTLACGQSRPAVIIQLYLDQQAGVLRVEPVFKWISMQANLSYEQSEEILARGDWDLLNTGYELACLLRQ
ncbi:MAG: RNB domain-containing ribonuclease, partial [Desulfonatronovibrionaceae bacterium]